MQTNIEKYKKDLTKLIDFGRRLHLALLCQYEEEQVKKVYQEKLAEIKKTLPVFTIEYQNWYSEAYAVVKQILPDRLSDFTRYYEKPKNRKEITVANYTIEDCLHGVSVTKSGAGIFEFEPVVAVNGRAAINLFEQQVNILKSIEKRFESTLFDIRQLVQADLFDSELDAAGALLKHGFARASGAIAGVVLEKHLAQVCDNHGVAISAKASTIGGLNELLKAKDVIDVTQWRFIQHLGDLRNLCDHNKKKEPTNDEVADLIKGVEKITKTIF